MGVKDVNNVNLLEVCKDVKTSRDGILDTLDRFTSLMKVTTPGYWVAGMGVIDTSTA